MMGLWMVSITGDDDISFGLLLLARGRQLEQHASVVWRFLFK